MSQLKFFIFAVSSLFWMAGHSQVVISKSTVDYGDIGPDTNLEREIFMVNQGSKEAKLLTTNFPREYDAHISAKNILPGDTVFLRWKFNPFMEGRFNDKITIWYSSMNEPIELKIKGDTEYIDPYSSPACPNFNERPPGQERTFLTNFVVIEEGTRAPVKSANVKIVDNGIVLGDFKTDRSGEKSLKLPIRYYYFLVEAEGYKSEELYTYVNSKSHRFTFEMTPLEEPPTEVVIMEEEIKEMPIAEELDTSIAESDIKNEEFSIQEYSPNNIVFLVDVSGSMNTNGRLEILKSAMIKMIDMMRPEDKISLVSYSKSASVILEPTSGADKDYIIDQIRTLNAKGQTSGEKGLKRAYGLARRAYITKGNNRVYIATDGVFKVSEEQSINKLVKKNARRKVYLSVLGIKGTKYTKKKMGALAAEGKGEFIALDDFDHSASELKNLIKKQSKK